MDSFPTEEIVFENADASDGDGGTVQLLNDASAPVEIEKKKNDASRRLPGIELVFETETGEARRRHHPPIHDNNNDDDDDAKVISFDLKNFSGRVTVRGIDDGGLEVVMKGAPVDVGEGPVYTPKEQSSQEGTHDTDISEALAKNQEWLNTEIINVPSSAATTGNASAPHDTDSSTFMTQQQHILEHPSLSGGTAVVTPSRNEDAMLLTESATTAGQTAGDRSAGRLPKLVTAVNVARRLRNKASLLRRRSSLLKECRRKSVDDIAVATTSLHQLCALPYVTLPELESALAREPDAISTRDAAGRLPLHVLGNNEALVAETSRGREVATKFGWTLMKTFPDAITALDDGGYMPFARAIEEWMHWVYETHQNSQELSESCNSRSRSRKRSKQSLVVLDGTSEALVLYSMDAFPAVQLYNEVEWCFSMLSLAMDGLGGREHGFHGERKRRYQGEDKQARAAVVAHLASKMPTLLKTVLLIEDDGNNSREKLLKMSIFRRMLLCPASVGPWLISMIRQKGIASQRSIDYMHLVSRTTVDDYVGGFANVLASDIQRFQEARKDVFDSVADLNGPIISLLILNEHEQERAVGTSVIWHAVQGRLLRPFVVHMVFIDFVLHIALLQAYRVFLQVGHWQEIRGKHIDAISKWVIISICIHYIIRKICECASIFVISKRAFKSYITSWWTILDLLTIALACVAVPSWVSSDFSTGFYTLLLGLLWIKILSFLRVVNRAMATFIIVLLRILRRMKYFSLVLVVIILMFGDMFHFVVSAKDGGRYCLKSNDTLSDPEIDFCSPDMSNSYLRVYALLLGDFETNDWRDSRPMFILWVIFTVVGIIVMLNLLIAVFSTSYEEACERSFLLFGRARIAFAAQSYSLEKCLRPKSLCNQTDHRWGLVDVLFRLLRHALLISLLGTATFVAVESFIVWRREYQVSSSGILTVVILVFMSVLLTLSIAVMFSFLLEFWLRGCAPQTVDSFSAILAKHSARMTEATASRLFGLTDVFGPDSYDSYDGSPWISHQQS